jgi:hypothetical protein
MPYEPHPIDTSSTRVPHDLVPLIERLAENTHDIWATRRIAEGWSYGPRRDDDQKQHPCLVPYPDLPTGEADYDRAMVTGLIEAMLALGYRIVRESPEEGPWQGGKPP